MTRYALLVGILLLAFNLTHATEADGTLKAVPVRVFVDTAGKVERFEFAQPETISQSINDFLTPNIQQTVFEPATINGQAATSELLMSAIFQVRAIEASEQRELRFITLEKTFASMKSHGTPNYPDSMLRQAISAYVLVSTEIGSDGRPIADSIALVDSPSLSDTQRIRAFFREAKRALLTTEFELTEKVNSKPVGGVLRVPYVFCINTCDLIQAEVARIRARETITPTPQSGIGLANVKSPPVPGG
jgi:hypothetical protein